MKQHVVNDAIALRYAEEVEHVWTTWQPHLDRCEQLLGAHDARSQLDVELVADALRRTQYRAHTAAEFTVGLVPPPSAVDAHASLLDALSTCRDALGVLAIRASLDELDDHTAEIGLHAAAATRVAFRGARSSTALVHAWVAEDRIDTQWQVAPSPRQPLLRHIGTWTTVAALGALSVVLLVDRLVLG